MVKQNKRAEYRFWVEPEVHAVRDELPGNIRQRIKRAVEGLETNPYPATSTNLDVADMGVPPSIEMRRIRMEHWRILYAVNKEKGWVWVLGIFRRPPYDYENLQELVAKLQ
jgi:mRNA interferase RelE/StbE